MWLSDNQLIFQNKMDLKIVTSILHNVIEKCGQPPLKDKNGIFTSQ